MNVMDQYITETAALYHADCIEAIQGLPSDSIGLSVFSPPFSSLYIYSDSERDMGNCADDDEFFQQFDFLIPELYRVTMPGRLCAVHCKNLVNYKGRDGKAGIRDFRGEIIRHFIAHDWAFHSEVCIWKDPVIEMQRTKAHGLLHKQLCADSSFSRQGLAEYLLLFRKWSSEEDTIEPVTRGKHRFTPDTHAYIGESEPAAWEYQGRADPNRQYSIAVWQRYASPVWMDIRQTNVLNIQAAREDKDEKHICPLQLDVIERAVELWTNPGDVVFDPFTGIGSTGYVAGKMGRRFVGAELKETYFKQAIGNLEVAKQEREAPTLFDLLDEEVTA